MHTTPVEHKAVSNVYAYVVRLLLYAMAALEHLPFMRSYHHAHGRKPQGIRDDTRGLSMMPH